jgi:hypothetical protein
MNSTRLALQVSSQSESATISSGSALAPTQAAAQIPPAPNPRESYVWASGCLGRQRLIASSNSAALTGLGM